MALPASIPKPTPRVAQPSNVVDLGRARPRPISSGSAPIDSGVATPVLEKTPESATKPSVSPNEKKPELESETSPVVPEEAVMEYDDSWDEDEEYDEEGSVDSGPRFDFIEGLFLIGINGIGDVVELLDLTGAGAVIGFLVDWFVGPAVLFWLWFKGVSVVGKNAIAQAAEFIPFIDLLPIRTVAIVLTIIGTNHPEFFAKLGFVGDVAKAFATKGKSVVSEAAKETMGKDS